MYPVSQHLIVHPDVDNRVGFFTTMEAFWRVKVW